MGEGLTRAAARNIFYGGSLFFLVVFVALVTYLGLAAAYFLTRLGHEVTIRDAGPMAGGMMRFGIPKYRLPRDVLDAAVARILALGVTLELDCKVTDIAAAVEAVREAVGRGDGYQVNLVQHLAAPLEGDPGAAGAALGPLRPLARVRAGQRRGGAPRATPRPPPSPAAGGRCARCAEGLGARPSVSSRRAPRRSGTRSGGSVA